MATPSCKEAGKRGRLDGHISIPGVKEKMDIG
jgi:hypothetical protein